MPLSRAFSNRDWPSAADYRQRSKFHIIQYRLNTDPLTHYRVHSFSPDAIRLFFDQLWINTSFNRIIYVADGRDLKYTCMYIDDFGKMKLAPPSHGIATEGPMSLMLQALAEAPKPFEGHFLVQRALKLRRDEKGRRIPPSDMDPAQRAMLERGLGGVLKLFREPTCEHRPVFLEIETKWVSRGPDRSAEAHFYYLPSATNWEPKKK